MSNTVGRRHKKRGITVEVLLLSALAFGLTLFLISSGAAQETTCPVTEEAEFIALINAMRVDSGRSVLATDARMMVAARRHADDMVTNDFISHIGSDGSTFSERLADAGYTWPLGETIVVGNYASTVATMFQMWVDSDPHRAILLHSSATHIGAGWATRPSGVWTKTCTVVLGSGSGAAEPPDCPCCTGRVGDANASGEDLPTIGDVSVIIDAKFITGTCDGIIDCLAEADLNQSGGADPTCEDVTIGDISMLIDCLFITGEPPFVRNECL